MKKRFTVLISLFLSICLCLCSCEGGTVAEEETTLPEGEKASSPQTAGELTVPFIESDGFHPYKMKNVFNLRLGTLIYDGLVSLNAGYEPVYEVAESCVNSGTVLNVVLDSTAKFSDGTFVSAADVVDSFNQAKKSDKYSERLRNFVSAVQSGGSAVTFTLEHADAFAENCLTFPIIRETENDDLPLGTGKYYVAYDDGRPILLENSGKKDFSPKISRIELQEFKTNEELIAGLEIGNICCFYDDLSSGTYTRRTPTSVSVLTNNLVFLGINSENEALMSPFIRRAVSALINRDDIAASAFQGHAAAAYSPFNPSWQKLPGESDIVSESKTPEELSKSSGIDTAPLTFRLIVSAGNGFRSEAARMIAEKLSAGGLRTVVNELAPEDYRTVLKTGEYEFYLGEVRLTENMDISPLFRGGSCSYGVTEKSQELSAARYEQLMSGDCQLIDFATTFSAELPFIPLCYRCGVLFLPALLGTSVTRCTDSDLFAGIAGWSVS